jgi:predicted transcriptional regulator
MSDRLTRERMIEAIRELPEDASVDDVIERLVFLAKIEEGLAQLDRGEGIPHDEVERRLGLPASDLIRQPGRI